MGRLVLVVGGEQPGLDALLTAARRRFAAEARVEFPPRLVTRRRTTGDTEISTSRRVFREIEREGGLFLSWETDGVFHGYAIGVREALSAGSMVVAAAPALAVPEAVKRWPDVRVVRLTVGTDAVRLPLLPRACLARMMGPALCRRSRAICGQDPVDARVHHSGDLSLAVRSLTEALLRVLGEPKEPRPRAAKPRSSSRPRAPRATAALVGSSR
jgi:phosphonate metabolism protein PhnN/1,5-bisphosphokinase (PRPP-forming)